MKNEVFVKRVLALVVLIIAVAVFVLPGTQHPWLAIAIGILAILQLL